MVDDGRLIGMKSKIDLVIAAIEKCEKDKLTDRELEALIIETTGVISHTAINSYKKALIVKGIFKEQ